MSLPPERISVKRRRQEDPVEALYLQENSSNHQKRRFTEYYFKLLRDDATPPAPPKRVQSQIAQPFPAQVPATDSSGIPTVLATAPGDEVNDFKRLIAAQKARRDADNGDAVVKPVTNAKGTVQASTPSASSAVNFQRARRFHLARTLSSFYSPDSSGGIRKPASKIRPPVPTFIERHSALLVDQDHHASPPVDRISDTAPDKAEDIAKANPEATEDTSRPSAHRSEATSFVKPMLPKKKWGTSINDHPSTWDLESDQLAKELSALAMEMDEESHPRSLESPAAVTPQPQNYAKPDVDMTDDFIYETYVRVPREDAMIVPAVADPTYDNYGLIVIDQEDEELWQQYMEEEEDSDWDEEDSNAEDNPANDYPEDEVSSDDEFGRAAYNHRQYGSDDEEYGDRSDDD